MNIIIYNTTDDRRKVGKNLSVVKEFSNANLKRPTDILNPVILVKDFVDSDTANFCYIPFLHRYYFIEDIVLGLGGIIEIHCKVDVLETYKYRIRDLTCLIGRQSGNDVNGEQLPSSERDKIVNRFIQDDKVSLFSDRLINTYTIGTIGTSHRYYLTTNGGIS